jgi:hypothetical protein
MSVSCPVSFIRLGGAKLDETFLDNLKATGAPQSFSDVVRYPFLSVRQVSRIIPTNRKMR